MAVTQIRKIYTCYEIALVTYTRPGVTGYLVWCELHFGACVAKESKGIMTHE